MSNEKDYVTVISPAKKRFELNFKETLKYRDLIFLNVRKTFAARFKQTFLGPLWAVIQPLLTTVVFTVVFGQIAALPTDGAPKFLFYMCGNIFWAYFSGCLTSNASIFSSNAHLFSKVYFPRLVMPVSNALSNFLNTAMQFVIFLIFWVYYLAKGGIQPHYALLWLVPLLVLQVTLLAMGIGMLVTALTVKYRDLQMLISFGMQLWLYATPIAYSSSLVKQKVSGIYTLFMLNPMASVSEGMRYVFLGTGELNVKFILISAAVSVLFALLGIVVFNRTEKTFTDKI